jgi:hypothetical protein
MPKERLNFFFIHSISFMMNEIYQIDLKSSLTSINVIGNEENKINQN